MLLPAIYIINSKLEIRLWSAALNPKSQMGQGFVYLMSRKFSFLMAQILRLFETAATTKWLTALCSAVPFTHHRSSEVSVSILTVLSPSLVYYFYYCT
jgi:hypothetical protein